MDVKAIQARLAAHAVERNWDPFFSPRSLSMAVAGEAGALLAVFQWLSEDQARRIGQTQDRGAVSESIADVVLYALRLAEMVDVDIEDAVLARAALKYPVSARRFEGVDVTDVRANAPSPRESAPPASIAPVRPAPAPRQLDTVPDPLPPRAAEGSENVLRSAPPPSTPVRPRPAEVLEDEIDEEISLDSGPRETPPTRSPVRPEPPARGRAEPAARERAELPIRAKETRVEPTPKERSDPPARVKDELPARSRAEPPPRAREEPPPRERADPPARERTPPPARAEPPAKQERYANLDTNAVLDLMKGLKKRIDDSRSDEAVLHEIKDEIDTLRRNVYSSKSKPAWIAGGLERLRALLEEAASHPVGDKINFRDYIGRISGLLES
jgi:NTP pyrophosphatase (non-canonical NTP hydrolase)